MQLVVYVKHKTESALRRRGCCSGAGARLRREQLACPAAHELGHVHDDGRKQGVRHDEENGLDRCHGRDHVGQPDPQEHQDVELVLDVDDAEKESPHEHHEESHHGVRESHHAQGGAGPTRLVYIFPSSLPLQKNRVPCAWFRLPSARVLVLMRLALRPRASCGDRRLSVVTPQARDVFRAGPTIMVLVGCCKHSVLLLFYCAYEESFLDFAGMTEVYKKIKASIFFKHSMHVCVVNESKERNVRG